MKIPLDNRTIGIALLVLGGIIYQAVATDIAAINTHLENPDENLRNAALVNARLSISTQIISLANTGMLVVIIFRIYKR